ncbi:DUF2059 domain-containing protein [Novipirellula sp. SH528]|uniref:DUF2059 domain-containing protein n=1 Tax=Novipirellula sp. SH528 TaxID=3454466 RepID=UPI003FA0B5C0
MKVCLRPATRFYLTSAFGIALFCSAASVNAQDTPAPAAEAPAAAAPATEEKVAAEVEKDSHTIAVEALLDSMNMKETTQQTVDQMLQMQVQQQPQMAAFEDVMKAFLHKHLSFESLKPDLIKLYKTEFTEAEIKALTEFYNTPVGKKAIEKLPTLSAAGAQIGMQRVQANMGELQQAILKRQTELQPK